MAPGRGTTKKIIEPHFAEGFEGHTGKKSRLLSDTSQKYLVYFP